MTLLTPVINFLTPVVLNFSAPTMLPPMLPSEPQIQQYIAHANNDVSYGLLASWYGPGFHGEETASGETYDQYDLTAAHPSLPFGTLLKVSYRGNSVVVRVNDRGPFTGGRGLDLSMAAAEQLGFIDAGVDYVTVTQL